MADNPRIEELRRRVLKDPTSIAFAQLAEEHRRAGEFEEAIRVCRDGLHHHPTYLSARVTLGRALLALKQYPEAEAELQQVLHSAPDNLAAIRALADIQQLVELLPDAPAQSPHAAGSEQRDDPEAPELSELEAWLAAILRDRAARRNGRIPQA